MPLVAIIVFPLFGAVGALAVGRSPRRLPSLIAALASSLALAVVLAQLPAVLDGEIIVRRWSWVPAVGLELALRFDGLVMNHAVFKASLFMATGIIDHEAGTRDMRRLGGPFAFLPITATLATVAAAAMAGVPLLNGFLSKEMFFSAAAHSERIARWPEFVQWLIPAAAVLGGLFSVAYSVRFIHDVFFGPRFDPGAQGLSKPRMSRSEGCGCPSNSWSAFAYWWASFRSRPLDRCSASACAACWDSFRTITSPFGKAGRLPSR